MAPIPPHVTTILFDLGGVVIDLDIPATMQAFGELGHKEITEIEAAYRSADFFKAYEIGSLDDEGFRKALRELIGREVSGQELDRAWNAMLLEISSPRIEKIKELANRFRVLVLSNTNHIHMQCFHQKLDQVMGLDAYHQVFDGIYYSFQLGMRKPDVSIFQHILDDQQLKPEEVYLIDDTHDNIVSANKMGMPTFHVTSRDQWLRELQA